MVKAYSNTYRNKLFFKWLHGKKKIKYKKKFWKKKFAFKNLELKIKYSEIGDIVFMFFENHIYSYLKNPISSSVDNNERSYIYSFGWRICLASI